MEVRDIILVKDTEKIANKIRKKCCKVVRRGLQINTEIAYQRLVDYHIYVEPPRIFSW